MCRIVVFIGTCTTCGNMFTWDDLTQQLACLEAKNAGIFGECSRGAAQEEHTFDQECDACAADEGVQLEEEEAAQWADAGSGRREKKDKRNEDSRKKKKQRKS